jgi:hypothetical protein
MYAFYVGACVLFHLIKNDQRKVVQKEENQFYIKLSIYSECPAQNPTNIIK